MTEHYTNGHDQHDAGGNGRDHDQETLAHTSIIGSRPRPNQGRRALFGGDRWAHARLATRSRTAVVGP